MPEMNRISELHEQGSKAVRPRARALRAEGYKVTLYRKGEQIGPWGVFRRAVEIVATK